MSLLDEARRELAQKTTSQIEYETAWQWAARAVAAYENLQAAHGDHQWLIAHVHFLDEAYEHAALADATGVVLRHVRDWVRQYVPT